VGRSGVGVRRAPAQLAGRPRASICARSCGELVSLAAEWTDAVPEDPFVVVAGGTRPVSSGWAALGGGAGRVGGRDAAVSWEARRRGLSSSPSIGLCPYVSAIMPLLMRSLAVQNRADTESE
jgi:hypothetical protein